MGVQSQFPSFCKFEITSKFKKKNHFEQNNHVREYEANCTL